MNVSSETRALTTGGSTNDRSVYWRAGQLIRNDADLTGTLVDVGCGGGHFMRYVQGWFGRYLGVDVIRYPEFPPEAEFQQIDMDSGRISLEDDTARVAVSLETVEHLENPRTLLRELVRVTQPGGLIVISTPNQLSFHSKLCFLFRNEFVQFQERSGLYPAHITALLEVDLLRMAREFGLAEISTCFTGSGRLPFSTRYWPRFLSSKTGWRGRAFSDNVFLVGRKPQSCRP